MSDSKISRAEFLRRAAAGAGAALLGAAVPSLRGSGVRAKGRDARPNILFICMDQLRSWPDWPDKLPLPSLRRLLHEGRAFRNYHVHQAPCGPSRSTFYTGQHIQKTGMYTNPIGEYGAYAPEGPRGLGVELPAGFPTIGTMLRAQGYYTPTRASGT